MIDFTSFLDLHLIDKSYPNNQMTTTYIPVSYVRAVKIGMVRAAFMKSLVANIHAGMNLKNTFNDAPSVVCVFACETFKKQFQSYFCPICGDYSYATCSYEVWRSFTTIPDNIVCTNKSHHRDLMIAYYMQKIRTCRDSIEYWLTEGASIESITSLESDIKKYQALLESGVV